MRVYSRIRGMEEIVLAVLNSNGQYYDCFCRVLAVANALTLGTKHLTNRPSGCDLCSPLDL